MIRYVISFMTLTQLCLFAQNEKQIPLFQADLVLQLDTLFVQNKDTLHLGKDVFNEELTSQRLDSLNRLSPLDLRYNKTVGKYIQFYLFQRRDQVSRLLALSEYYFPIFEEFLNRHSLPLELKYLPIIESSLNPNAKSPVGATGIWQFMYFTAKEYGLRINSYLDERKDIYKSTEAACQYFKKSFNVFENWELALASYNAGRGNVTKSIRRSGGKLNYWEISPFLPRETRNYVPSFIAALYVMNFAHEHGISPSKKMAFRAEQVDSIYLKKPVKIQHLADILNIESKIIEELNPSYSQKLIPKLDTEKFPIFLPEYKWGWFLANEDSIYVLLDQMEEKEGLEYPLFTDVEKVIYKVKKGDYLGRIARKYNCRVSDIMLWNDLKNTKIKEGKKLYIYKNIK